jgi:hypothetical protein
VARQSSRSASSRAASSKPAVSKPAPAEQVEEEAVVVEDTAADTTEVEDADTLADEAAAEDASAEDASDEDASAELAEDDEDDAEEDADFDEEDGGSERTAQADAMWNDVQMEPVEIALPKGVGYTLRAYRLSTDLTPTEVDEEEDDFAILHRRPAEDEDDERVVILENPELFEDEPEPAVVEASSSTAKKRPAKKNAADSDDSDDSDDDEADDTVAELDKDTDADEVDDVEAEAEADEEEEEDEEEEAEPEEVPAFLTHRGKLLLFRSVEGLVEFVKNDTVEHDLIQVDTWAGLKKRITVSSVVPTAENRYELDLVVENLRGGQDAWDSDLLLAAGEAARDLAYALRLEAVRTALSPGSPLDDLDEGLRAAASGGVGGFFAKRRLKKIGAQQAALGWRTIIGKISTAVDWRD